MQIATKTSFKTVIAGWRALLLGRSFLSLGLRALSQVSVLLIALLSVIWLS